METNETITEKKRLPADLFSDDIPKGEVNPFADKVKEKGYTNVSDTTPLLTNGSEKVPPPIEPAFKESKEESEPSTAEKAFNDKEFKSTPPPPQAADGTSPATATAEPLQTPEEIKSNAEQSVKMFWEGYEQLYAVGRWVGKVNINELRGLDARGKINLKHEFPAKGGQITAIEVFEEQNKHIDESIQVSLKLKTDLTPPLERLAVKHKFLLNDEWYVGITLGKDLVVHVGMLWGIHQTYKNILEFLINEAEEKKKGELKSKKESTKSEKEEPETTIPAEEAWNEPGEPGEPEEKQGEQQATSQ